MGRPLILLHGGLVSARCSGCSCRRWPEARGHHRHLQGHGRTADIDRPLDARLMAGDIVALIGHLGLEKPDVMGYSLGGGVAFWTAATIPSSSGG